MRAVAFSVLCLALPGCVLDPVPVDGLRCPCLLPYECDDANDTCVPPGSPICGRSGKPASPLRIVSFASAWVTAHQASLEWTVSEPADVAELAVDLADSDAALRDGAFATVDGTDNPELARPFLQRTGTSNPVTRTTIRELVADRSYVARLVLVDRGGAVSCSRAVPLRTNLEPAPESSVTIYDDAMPVGARTHRPCTVEGAGSAPSFDGSRHIEHQYRCEQRMMGTTVYSESVCTDPMPPGPACFENVGLVDANIDVRRIGEGNFASAYLEFAAALDDVADGFWSEPGIVVGSDVYDVDRVTLVADGDYHHYEIPIAVLRCVACTPVRVLDYAQLQLGLTGARVGTTLSNAATLRLDAIRLRW